MRSTANLCAARPVRAAIDPVALRHGQRSGIGAAVLFESHFQPAALRHGLRAILNHIQRRLLQQIGVYVGNQRLFRHRLIS